MIRGLKGVTQRERCTLISTGCCKRIFCVYKGREPGVGKHSVVLCESGLKGHETRARFADFVTAFLHIHNADLESQRKSCLRNYMSNNVKEGNHIQVVFLFSSAGVRNEQLGLCLLIIWLVWLSLFVLPLSRRCHRTENELKVICFSFFYFFFFPFFLFVRRLHKLFTNKANKTGP